MYAWDCGGVFSRSAESKSCEYERQRTTSATPACSGDTRPDIIFPNRVAGRPPSCTARQLHTTHRGAMKSEGIHACGDMLLGLPVLPRDTYKLYGRKCIIASLLGRPSLESVRREQGGWIWRWREYGGLFFEVPSRELGQI